MKYSQSITTAAAVYDKEQGNPFLEALPELLSKTEFEANMRSSIRMPPDIGRQSTQLRRNYLSALLRWFQPMDYMYTIYDLLYRCIRSTYQTKTTVEAVRQLNRIYLDFRTGREHTMDYATQAESGAILGVPGIGKTSTVNRCLNLMPQVIEHTQYQGQACYTKQINYLVVECPSDCSIKTLAFNIFAAIDKALGSNYFAQAAVLKAQAASAIATRMKIICMNHHIGMIVIDEIQNAIQTAARNRQTRPLIKFLLELTNETSTSIIFCGTLEAEEVFVRQEHLKRRTRGLRLLPLKFDITYRKFITELWEYQTTLQKAELTEKLMKQIYDLSAGIPAYIVKIFQEAQIQAILSGKEKLSYEMFKQAVLYSGIEVPKVYGRGGTSISDFSVQEIDAEVFDWEKSESADLEDAEPVSALSVNPVPVIEDQTVPVDGNSMETECTDPQEVPVRRFYATKRGRRAADRDVSDLLTIWKERESAEYLLESLKGFQMLERRCF